MTTEQKTFLKDLSERYNLTKEDFFKSPQGWVIIKRQGIDKIQGKAKIKVEFQFESIDPKFVIVKATAYGENAMVESYGEASPENCKNKYPVAMAEKRALSRVILKLVGAYGHGIYTEDEAEDFKSV